MSQAGEIDVVQNHPEIPTQFDANIGNAVPIGNILNILGATVGAGTSPVFTTGSGNTIITNVQISQAIASTNAANIGLAAFDSSSFAVDANGFVTLSGSSVVQINVDASTPPGTDPVIPSGGVITMTGAQVAAGVIGANVIRTDSLAANTVTIEIQRSTAVAATDSTKNGVSHFSSSQFAVDSSGFVTLAGGGQAIDSIGTQTGTNPITPTSAGLVTINGAVVAAGTNPVRSDGTGANTMAIEVQISQALAATDATKIGLCNFHSGQFSVDANGFVELAGQGLAIDSFSPDSGTDPVVPTAAGLVNMKGSGSITTVGSLNTLTTQLTGLTNHAVLVGAGTTTITKLAVGTNGQVLIGATGADPAFATLTSSDSSISFTTGANTLSLQVASGTAVVKTLTGDTGGALSPTAGNINTLGSGSITIAGSGSTLTTQLTGLTNHNVLIGAGTATITKVAPSATTGIPLVSQGASADPSFSTAVVAGGGTGQVTLTNHGVLVGAGTSAITQLAVGATGTVLAGSTGADPSFTATPSVTSITLSSGTALSTYVQGTFTPAISFGGGTTGITYTSQTGQYTQIGNIVHFFINLQLSNKGSSTGQAAITGLPVATSGTAQATTITFTQNVTMTANYQSVFTQASGSTFPLFQFSITLGTTNLTNTQCANNSSFQFNGFYFTS